MISMFSNRTTELTAVIYRNDYNAVLLKQSDCELNRLENIFWPQSRPITYHHNHLTGLEPGLKLLKNVNFICEAGDSCLSNKFNILRYYFTLVIQLQIYMQCPTLLDLGLSLFDLEGMNSKACRTLTIMNLKQR